MADDTTNDDTQPDDQRAKLPGTPVETEESGAGYGNNTGGQGENTGSGGQGSAGGDSGAAGAPSAQDSGAH